jgi:type II secretory pathway pseudopilin PulG
MKKMTNRGRQAGFSLMETLAAVAMMMIALIAALIYISASIQGTKQNKDKAFAVQKAISILEEMKGLVETTEGDTAAVLDDMDDGAVASPILTVDSVVSNPSQPGSDNVQLDGGWKFDRLVSVRKFPSIQSNDVRLVSVKVHGAVDGERHLLAEVSSVIRTIGDNFPPTQVYDVYLLAMENVPGWWVYMANLVPFAERAMQELESRNPGLEFRPHWIRTLSYGRDREYLPFVNDQNPSTSDIDHVYFYPGTMPSGSAVSHYYPPGAFRGAVNIDGTTTNGYESGVNPLPYALADQYNHAMRYPDEKSLFDSRVALGLEQADTPTWRLLLEEMYVNPENFENALLVNLHGELYPFPPIRNYSDAAKDPSGRPQTRVVTHPERLRYGNSDDISLRVYSYLTDPDDGSLPDRLTEPISILIQGVSPVPGLVVQAIEGGLDLAPVDSAPDPYAPEQGDMTSSHTGDMYYQVQAVGGGTLITLYNSPLRTPCEFAGCGTGGLATEKRLYGLEYIPTPLDAGGSGPFTRNLTTDGNRAKNTARWRITIPDADLPNDGMITIETRIGNDLTTGALYPTRNEPTNLSRTYLWRGSDLWTFGDGTAANPPHLPLTERHQIMGDPRHSPYADLMAAYSAGNPLGVGYNRYFDDFHSTAHGNKAADGDYWLGLSGVKSDGDANNDGWYADNDMIEIDVNRTLQILRASVLRAQSVYTTLTGWSYFYVGVGGEIGYDAQNNFPNSIPVSSKPYTGSSGTRQEQSITDTTIDGNLGGVKYVKENVATNYWWSINWLGELYPDSEYSAWVSDGNLPTGPGEYQRVRRSQITEGLPTGTSLVNSTRRTGPPGSTTFFSIGSASSKFHHQAKNGQTGSLDTDGLDISASYNFTIPASVGINRPFNTNLDATGPVPDHYQEATYDTGSPSVSTLARYFDHQTSSQVGSSLLEIPGAGSDISFVVVNGLSPTGDTGSAFIARWSFLTLIHSFLTAGLSSDSSRIEQLPRILITAPNEMSDLTNPSSIGITWDATWTRWDGQPYTASYTSGFTESSALSFAVTYSDDGGRSWKYVQDDSNATPGVRPDGSHTVTSQTYGLSVPTTKFPEGSYVVRVEAYRDDIELHHAYHQQRIFIKR